MKMIDRNLNRRLLRFSIILPYVFIPATELNFTIQYNQDVNSSKYYYNTTYGEGTLRNITNATSIENTVHNVSVVNFTGFFVFERARIVKPLAPKGSKVLCPARFVFRGYCDSITID